MTGSCSFASRYNSATAESILVQDYIVKFAAQKLIKRDLAGHIVLSSEQQFTFLSAHLPIEFMSSVSMTQEQDQVANHMRVYLALDDSVGHMRSLNPSESILAEGAHLLITNKSITFNALAALLNVLNGFSVNQGDCGGLVVMLALLLAQDCAVAEACSGIFGIVSFLCKLLNTASIDVILNSPPFIYQCEAERGVTLRNAFKDIYLHYNQFIKQ